MKKFILSVAVALTIASPAFANDPCAGFEEFAEAVIVAKQRGMSMSQAMGIIDTLGTTPVGKMLLRAVVMDAYKLPDLLTDEFREQQIIEFRNAIASSCYRALNRAGALD